MEVTERTHLLSPQQRRLRNRQEVIDAILAAAREIMRRDGVAALNLNEVARLVGMQTPSLYKYFPSKFALYEALFRMALRLFRESEEQIWNTSQPIWERIEAWFETRLRLVQEHPDLYHLFLDNPVPGFLPSPESLEEVRKIRAPGVQAITEAMDAGLIATHLTPDRVLDLLLAMRRGIIAEHLGKETHLPVGDERFRSLIPEVLALLKAAWAPQERNAELPAHATMVLPAPESEPGRSRMTDLEA
jgi:AcrR family transcriptional regulator